MKLPNSYGSVYKLSGKRRNPWVARKTTGWNEKGYPIYQFIGFYPTRIDALQSLANYNKDPYDLHLDKITFAEVYKLWSEQAYPTMKQTRSYKAAYKICKPIDRMAFADIKLDHLQKVIDESGKNKPTLKSLKNMWSLIWKYAVLHEIVTPDKHNLIRYIDISKAGNPDKQDRIPFSKADIQYLWDNQKSNEYISTILILIYTGLRIGELLNLKKDDIYLDERWFYVRESKTKSGIREVPIAEKIVPFFEHWLKKDCDYLICTPENKKFTYHNYNVCYWKHLICHFKTLYTPHCTRHTLITLLTEIRADERIIQQIVGHKGQGVTQSVYTHIDLATKLEVINQI